VEDDPAGGLARLPGSAAREWWPALPHAARRDGHAHGATSRTVPLLNARRVPPGEHTDLGHPAPVVATLRWATGAEQTVTDVLERWTTDGGEALVRVRVRDPRVLTAAVWLPAADVTPV
jgi:hypothetical protein